MRRLSTFLTLTLLSTATPALMFAQTPSACEQDLNAVLGFLAEDYAGYPRFAKNWPDRLEEAIGRARADVVGVVGKECDFVIRRLLAVFHDGHLGLHSQFSPAVEMPTPMFYEDRSPKAVPLASDAFLVRVPSFAVSYKEELDRLLAKHADEIRTRPYLVIDVRGNTGGGDTTWVNLIGPVLDGPLERWPILWRVSEGNAKAIEAQAEQARARGAAPALCKTMISIAAQMRGSHEAELVPLGPPLRSTVPVSEVWEQPTRIGILIDGSCSSSGENFLLAARQSKKVTLFGAPTYGAMDFQNARMAALPSGKRRLMFGMTMSTRLLKEDAEPERGIKPDIEMNEQVLGDEDKAVDFVLANLRRASKK